MRSQMALQRFELLTVLQTDDILCHHRLLGRDLGSMMEIYGGLSGGERLVVNPSDEVREGVHVRTSEEKPPPK